MKLGALLALVCVSLAVPTIVPAQIPAQQLAVAEGMLESLQHFMLQEYHPASRLPSDLAARWTAVRRQLAQTNSFENACALIAETFLAVDTRLKLSPPGRAALIEYGWSWRVIGNEAFVTYVRRDSDAAMQGLQPGDRVLSIEGTPVNRASHEQILYRFGTLAPHAALRVRVQAPGQGPRPLTLAAKTIARDAGDRRDLPDRWFGRAPLGEDEKRREEFYGAKRHFHRLGSALVWRPEEFQRGPAAVASGLREIRDATALILDLRGQSLRRPEAMLRLLDAIFEAPFEIGVVRKNGVDHPLRVAGDTSAFKGEVLVLTDSRTSGYAEVLARVIQQRRRGVTVGDRTMGHVAEEIMARYFWGGSLGEPGGAGAGGETGSAALSMPVGEISLSNGPQLDGIGVAPDLPVLAQSADLLGRRDVALAHALAVAQQPLSPEAAYQLLRGGPENADLEE